METYIERILDEGAESVTIGRADAGYVVRCWNSQWIGGAKGREGFGSTMEEAARRAWQALTYQPQD
jgi:hypothetical protein